uniref:trafficking kinesin-binding protein 1-like isoform X2 n=1 Tax=Monopterus albus TaxID=43700 RepID=UPI0009B39528|nr:trafficking kinesin-binding protein 1-like isoform X2 [Monopterus albus]
MDEGTDAQDILENKLLPLRRGSVTLHQWQQLAKTNLGGILQPRPGVLTKDFRELEVDIQQVCSLNNLEEHEPDLSQPSGAHGRSLHLVPTSARPLPHIP